MKVILIDEIHGLGGRGDVVNVRDGYARNYLLPKNLARVATPGNLKAVETEKKKWSELSSREKSDAQQAAKNLEGLRLTIARKVGEAGTLFGSVTASDIAAALAAAGVEIDRRRVHIDHPIKSSGEHTAEVRLHREVTATITVDVVSDKQHGGTSTAPPAGTAGHAQAARAAAGETAGETGEEATADEQTEAASEAGEPAAEETATVES